MPALAAAPKIDDHAPLAHVNGDTITVHDLLDAFTSRHGGHAKFLGGKAEAREFLNLIIDDRLFLQEAYDIGLDQDETVKQVVDEYTGKKAAEALVKLEIDDKSAPTEEEVQAAFKQLNFMVHVRQIIVETKEEAEEVRRAVLQGADFDAFARTCSIADSRSHGGHLVANWGQFSADWEKVVFALGPGEVSPIFETPDGYEFDILGYRADVDLPALDKVKSQIEVVLRQRKSDERKRAFGDELRAKYHVKLQPVDFETANDAVVATWDGGQLTLGEIFEDNVLEMIRKLPPVRARYEIDSRIKATVNAPLTTLEAKARKIEPEDVNEYRETIMRKALFRDHVFKDVAVTDDDVKKYYDAHQSEFVEGEQRHVAHIMTSTEKDAVTAREKLVAGSDFAEVAKKFSRDYMTASSGGDLGWITQDKVPAAFNEVWALSTGDLSKPIKSQTGWHVIKVLEIKPRRQMTMDEVKDRVRQAALDEKQRSARSFWREKLRAAAKIELDDAAIQAFVAANEFTAPAPPQHKTQ